LSKGTGMDGTIMTFLMSSFNIELVNIILSTVSKNTVGVSKIPEKQIKGRKQVDFHKYREYDFKNANAFTLDYVEIADTKVESINDVMMDHKRMSVKILRKQLESHNLSDSSFEAAAPTMLNEDVLVTEYAPDVFAFLRAMDGYDNDSIKKSLHPDNNKKSVFKAGESQGKSGSFFFFSEDEKFIIKTMTDSDFNAFMRLFRSYVRHICRNRKSLLARIYGIYSIQMGEQQPVKLVVMGHTIQVKNKNMIRHTYDLKGSMVNREVKGKTKPTAPVKDKNLLKDVKLDEEIFLNFSPHD